MSALMWLAFDGLLAALLLGLGWAATVTTDMKRAVVLFIAFGLLLALAWSRLAAPDLALAEAAIGAGIAGVLLLAALREEPRFVERAPQHGRLARWTVNLLILGFASAVAWALLDALGGDAVRLGGAVRSEIENSGVSNPVTAVLLNFRAYDTLLELAVILAAVLGVLALGPARAPYRAAGPLLQGLIQLLVPVLVVVSGYLLWVGAHAPGGAFQAGATLAAAAILLHLGGDPNAGLPRAAWLRGLLAAGLAVFLGVGLLVVAADLSVLQYPAGWSGVLILLIEMAATFAIAVALIVAYLGGRPRGWESESTTQPASELLPVSKERLSC